jgi:general stress protein 26
MLDATQREKLRALLAHEQLAVIVTQGDEWPTATMQAFAETPELDLVFIMIDSAAKFQNLLKRPHATVLIDSRHSIERATLEIPRASIEGVASEIPRDSAEWNAIKPEFLTKNPFEAPFFNHPSLRMVRIRPLRVSYAGAGRDTFKADF